MFSLLVKHCEGLWKCYTGTENLIFCCSVGCICRFVINMMQTMAAPWFFTQEYAGSCKHYRENSNGPTVSDDRERRIAHNRRPPIGSENHDQLRHVLSRQKGSWLKNSTYHVTKHKQDRLHVFVCPWHDIQECQGIRVMLGFRMRIKADWLSRKKIWLHWQIQGGAMDVRLLLVQFLSCSYCFRQNLAK